MLDQNLEDILAARVIEGALKIRGGVDSLNIKHWRNKITVPFTVF